MLQELRNQKNSGLIVVIFALIILAFIFMFGLPSTDCASKAQSDVGSVGNHSISHEMLRSQVLMHIGDDNIFSKPQYADVAKNMTRSIGLVYLLADRARESGLRVSDEELTNYITNWEMGNVDIFRLGFLLKNSFSQRNYENALSRYQLSTRDYEAYKREELLARRYLELLGSSISVSNETLWQEYSENFRTADIKYVQIRKDDIRATLAPLTDDDIAAFKASGEADIKAYYETNISKYTTPVKIKLQRITIQKNMAEINPGAKTVKTQPVGERVNYAMNSANKEGADFNAVFDDYDESNNKTLKGQSDLDSVFAFDFDTRNAVADKKVGDVFQIEYSDRIVIAKLVEKNDQVIKSLDEVRDEIIPLALDEKRVKERMDQVSKEIFESVKAGKAMDDAINDVLYANIASEKTVVNAEENAENTDAPAADDAPAAADAPADVANNGTGILFGKPSGGLDAGGAFNGMALPSLQAPSLDLNLDLNTIVVDNSARIKAKESKKISTNTEFVEGIGTHDELSRDIRSASAGTLLPKIYQIDVNTVAIVSVEAKEDANRDAFNVSLDELREDAIAEKKFILIGNIDGIINLSTSNDIEYGFWIKEILENAESSGTLSYNDRYFDNIRAKNIKRQEEAAKRHEQ